MVRYAVDVAALAASRVLRLHPNADLHRGPPGGIDRGGAGEELTHGDREDEGHPIHRRGDDAPAAVADGGDACGLVAELHHHAAVDEAGGVRVADPHPPDEDRPGLGGRFGLHGRRSYASE